MFLHPPIGPQLDQLPGLSITSSTPETVSYPRQVTTHTTAPFVNTFCTYCALNRVCLYTFPTDTTWPLSRINNHLPTITLDFPAFTFNPLPSRLALQSATHLPSCSIVGAIITRSPAYSNLQGRPLLASLETTSMTAANNSGLSICSNYSASLCIQCHNCADEPLIHTQLPQSPSHHLSWDSIKCLL